MGCSHAKTVAEAHMKEQDEVAGIIRKKKLWKSKVKVTIL